MKPSELFRAAAREIERRPHCAENGYACWTLWRLIHPQPVRAGRPLGGFPPGFRQALLPRGIRKHLALLKPTRPHAHGSWWPAGGLPYQDERILMLCFAAAIAEEAGE